MKKNNPSNFATRAHGLLAASVAAILFGACSPIPKTEVALPHHSDYSFNFDKLNKLLADLPMNGTSVLVFSDGDQKTIDHYIKFQKYEGRSAENPRFGTPTVASPMNLGLDEGAKKATLNLSMNPTEFTWGVNMGCSMNTLESMGEKYPNVRFYDFIPGQKMSIQDTDVICLEGEMDLSSEEGIAAKAIEFHGLKLNIQDNKKSSFIIDGFTYAIDGQNSVVLATSPRLANNQEDADRVSNRGILLQFRQLTGNGKLMVDSYGEDAIGFQSK